MTFNEFLAKYNNKFWDFDGAFGNQCFDLFQFYNRDVVGGTFVSGNGAADIWNTYPKDLYTKINSIPTNWPDKGDVVIWGTTYGQFGHVGIATGAGNADTFECLEQNDPIGSNSHLRTYNYNHVLGWLRPKDLAEPIVDCAEVQKQVVYERTEKEKYKTRSRELAEALEKETKAKESAIEVNLNLIKRQTEMEKIYVEDAKRAKEQREADLKTIKNREAVILDPELRETVLINKIKELEDSEKLTLCEFSWNERFQSLFSCR